MKITKKQNPTPPKELVAGQVYHVFPFNELVEIENVEEKDGVLIVEGKWPYDYARRFTFVSKNNNSFLHVPLLEGQLFHHIIFTKGMPEKIVID